MFGTRGFVLLVASALPGLTASDCDLLLFGLPQESVPLEVSLSADREYANVGDDVTFTADVTGGAAPYSYYWQMDSDSAWTSGGRSYTRTMDAAGIRSVYFLARDANGDESDIYSVQLTALPSGAPTSSSSSSSGDSDPPGQPSPVRVEVAVDNRYPSYGDTVTLTATVTGGTPPYSYFWWLDGDSAWTSGGRTISRKIEAYGTVSMYFLAWDANGIESDQFGVQVNVAESDPTYDSLAGCYSTSYGTMVLSLGGGMVYGTYTYDGGILTGYLDGHVLTGTWSETPDNGEPDIGAFEFTFSEGWDSFTGRWGPDGSSWNGSWSGRREDCDD